MKHTSVCQFCLTLAAIVLLLGLIAAVIGVAQAHIVRGAIHYGSAQGSLSLIALTLSVLGFLKVMKEWKGE